MNIDRIRATCAGILIFAMANVHAALIDNGGGLIYDDVLNITWAQPDNTLRTWDDAKALAAGLTLGGVSGWRLPYASVAAGEGPVQLIADCFSATELACRDNEMGYMFYYSLGGSVWQAIVDSGDPDLALFPSLQPFYYWSSTEYDDYRAYEFAFEAGFNGAAEKNGGPYNNLFYTWAVHEGNISPVPLPAALGLFVAGLTGLLGFAKFRNKS